MNAILNHLKPRVRYEPICSQVNDIWSHWKGVLATKLPSTRICNSLITNNLCKSMPSIVALLIAIAKTHSLCPQIPILLKRCTANSHPFSWH